MAESLRGKLLVASPELNQSAFRRTVILLIEHGRRGTLGLVLNRASIMPVGDPLPSWQHIAATPDVMFHGGPVRPEGVVCLARGGQPAGAGYTELMDGVGTVDLHLSPDDVVGITELRVFSGHAGWSDGQLEGELRRRDWIVVESEPDDAFSADPEDLWRDVLARQPAPVSMLAGYPDEVILN